MKKITALSFLQVCVLAFLIPVMSSGCKTPQVVEASTTEKGCGCEKEHECGCKKDECSCNDCAAHK